jgi:glycosyltransferase A (GT-A) superfamily protein (DUF2064 family)
VTAHLVVVAKAPVPGRVKTRLCPPCTPVQAARVARAALQATLAAVAATPAARRTLLLAGRYPAPPGWATHPQRGDGLAHRLAHGLHDTWLPGTATLLVGMDTPQARPADLGRVLSGLSGADAVLAPAPDGGWWALALRDARHGTALAAVPMSTPDTARLTVAALRRRNLRVRIGPLLRDVDTAADALAVAALCDGGPFPAAVAAHVPRPAAHVPGSAAHVPRSAAHVPRSAAAPVPAGRAVPAPPPGEAPCVPR